MYTTYVIHDGGLRPEESAAGLAAGPVWVDMLHPTREEEQAVEAALGIEVPTRAEMQEIEVSSRLYAEAGALFMTATLLAQAESETPEAKPVTFVLAGNRLITIRYCEPRAFRMFAARAARPRAGFATGEAVLIGVLEAVVDRAADVLETLAAEVDKLSAEVFQRGDAGAKAGDFRAVLHRLGRAGDLDSKARESLVSLGRLLAFLAQELETRKAGKEARARVATMIRDAQSLGDHASFVSNKVNFLLEAVLGLISIEQNGIIKIFSVVAVAFLPPTLIASIYGMNFHVMPELDWRFGYPLALGLMVLSAVLPYLFFKRKGWL